MDLELLLTRLDKLVKVIRFPRLLRALLYDRVLAGVEHRHALSSNLATVIDVGANRGQFCLAVRQWAPRAIVFAFEPLSEPADLFRKVFRDDFRVTMHQVAIGQEAGEATIHVSVEDDSSSLLPISNLQQRLFPGTGEVRTETIKVGKLSNFISAKDIVAPGMLKLDVQGYEIEALKGCEDLLDYFSYVYAECSFVELYTGQALADEIIAWMRERDFILSGIYNLCYDKNGRALQGDYLFINRKKIKQLKEAC